MDIQYLIRLTAVLNRQLNIVASCSKDSVMNAIKGMFLLMVSNVLMSIHNAIRLTVINVRREYQTLVKYVYLDIIWIFQQKNASNIQCAMFKTVLCVHRATAASVRFAIKAICSHQSKKNAFGLAKSIIVMIARLIAPRFVAIVSVDFSFVSTRPTVTNAAYLIVHHVLKTKKPAKYAFKAFTLANLP